MKMKFLTVLFLISIITLTGCVNDNTTTESKNNIVEKENTAIDNSDTSVNQTSDIKTLVNDYSSRNKTAQRASISSTTLTVTEEDGTESVIDVSKEDFFVSIAPYIENTHPCETHNLIGCKGELANKDFTVYIEDSNKNVVVDKVITSHPNGFIDLWLPRNTEYSAKIEYEGKVSEFKFSTFENDNTCISTAQLQ